MHPVIWLIAAIGSEVIATTSLKLSEGFSRPLPAEDVAPLLRGAAGERVI